MPLRLIPDDEDRVCPIRPPLDFWMTLRFPGELGVLLQEAAQFEDDITELFIQEPGLRPVQCSDEPLQGLT